MPRPELRKVHAGDCVELINDWDAGWVDLVLSGPSATGSGQERKDRELSWINACQRVLKPSGILATIWPIKDLWGWGQLLWEARWQVHLVRRVTCSRSKANWSSQCVIVATPENGLTQVPNLDAHFEQLTDPGWSSGFHPEIGLRVVETYTEPDAIVLDPFFGRGNTAIACEWAGRPNWLGCECEELRIPEAMERIGRLTHEAG